MRRADRLFQIVHLLRRDRATTAAQLANELEVSERTIYRDVQDLMASGVPIQGEAGVGYALPAHFDLPPLMFTAIELEALVLGARMVQGFADDELQRAARSALAKVETVAPRALAAAAADSKLLVPDLPFDANFGPTLALLRKALRSRHVVHMTYRDEGGARSERDVWPLGLAYWGKVWTLVAWCELRGGFRSFRLDRVDAATTTVRRFHDEPGKRLEDFLAQVHAEADAGAVGACVEGRRGPVAVGDASATRKATATTPQPVKGTARTKSGAPVDADERAAWRAFQQLGSVGPATAGDLLLLGFRRVDELRGQDARELHARMCALTGTRQDPCVEDVFRCVIAQAEHADLPERLQQWHHWTPLRGQPPGTMPGPMRTAPSPKRRR
jgi:predicted DNA-binding transcriptional regulator YafY